MRLQSTLEGGRPRGGQRKCWMDKVKEWTSLPMQKLLRKIIAFHRKTGRIFLLNRALRPLDDPIGRRTELNCISMSLHIISYSRRKSPPNTASYRSVAPLTNRFVRRALALRNTRLSARLLTHRLVRKRALTGSACTWVYTVTHAWPGV